MPPARALAPFQLALRVLQASSAASALSATLYGYRDAAHDDLERPSTGLTSLAVLLITLALYSSMLWALFYVLVLGACNMETRRPSGGCQRVLDGFHGVCALSAGVLLVSVDAFKNCQDSSLMHCGALRTGAKLSFATSALLAVSFVLGWLERASVAAAVVNSTAAPSAQHAHDNDSYVAYQSPPARDTTDSERELSNALCTSDMAELRRGIRFLQAGGSIIALVNVLLGSKRVFADTDVVFTVVFTMLATYTSAVFSGWHLLVVDLCELAEPLTLMVERATEIGFSILLLAAGILFEAVDPTDDCDGDCRGHTAAVTFVFIVAAAFVADLAFTFTKYQDAKVLRPVLTLPDQYHRQDDFNVPRQGQHHTGTLSAVIA